MSKNARRIALGLLAGAALALAPLAAAAQGVYAEQVWTYLDEMQGEVAGEGFSMEGEYTGWMVNGAEGAAIVLLPPGDYVAFGACDDDCSDIDLMAVLMATQETLDFDQEMDSFPIVTFSLSEETEVLISITMPDCATARCYAGFRWFSSDMADVGMEGAGAGGWEQQIAAQLETMEVMDATGVEDERMGLVAAGEEDRFSLPLGPGSYEARAVCDYDCSDVDLAVFDAGGTLIGSDVLVDDIPIVDFRVRKGGGTYYFAVQMVDCITGSCGYGFRLYKTSGR